MYANGQAMGEPVLERLMADYGDCLLRLCYLYLRDYQLAEDAVQETFLRLYTKYSTFKRNSSEKTWVTRIAINTCKSLMRKRSFGELPSDGVLSDHIGFSPEEMAMEADRDIILFHAVCGLEPIYREVILLFYYHSLRVHEIALALKTREGTVKARLTRARGKLSEILKEEI